MTAVPLEPARRPLSHFSLAPLRSVLRHRRVEPRVAAVLRGRVVHESAAFALRELSGRHAAYVYRIRENGLRVLVLHASADAASLDQAFYERAHEPPAGALEALRSLGRPPRALDLGANVGMWGLWLHGRFPGAQVVALEPDPENVARHRRQIELNGLRGSWEVIQAAAVTEDGPVAFAVGRDTLGRVAAAGDAGTEMVPGRDAFALLDDLDLLKLDIEGGEWAILADPRAAELRVPVVMLEYHAHGAPGDDPATAARAALERAGYVTATAATGQGTGVVWGWGACCASAST